MSSVESSIWVVGIKIFLLVWFIFVPVAMTARLEKIIRLLEDQNK